MVAQTIKLREVVDIVFVIPVGEADEVAAGVRQARPDGRAIALVARMMDDRVFFLAKGAPEFVCRKSVGECCISAG